MHENGRVTLFSPLDAIFLKGVQSFGKIEKTASFLGQAKIGRAVSFLPLVCAMQIYQYLNRGGTIFQGRGKESIGKNR